MSLYFFTFNINKYNYKIIYKCKRWRKQRKDEMARELKKRNEDEKRKCGEEKAKEFYSTLLLR